MLASLRAAATASPEPHSAQRLGDQPDRAGRACSLACSRCSASSDCGQRLRLDQVAQVRPHRRDRLGGGRSAPLRRAARRGRPGRRAAGSGPSCARRSAGHRSNSQPVARRSQPGAPGGGTSGRASRGGTRVARPGCLSAPLTGSGPPGEVARQRSLRAYAARTAGCGSASSTSAGGASHRGGSLAAEQRPGRLPGRTVGDVLPRGRDVHGQPEQRRGDRAYRRRRRRATDEQDPRGAQRPGATRASTASASRRASPRRTPGPRWPA